MENINTEELVLRWKARRDIENLCGKRFSYTMLRKTEEEWDKLWCKKAPNPVLGFNEGCYVGYEAISAYFAARRVQDKIRGQLAAGFAGVNDKSADSTVGMGSLNLDPLTTPVIEIAGDMQTAKGLWYIVGAAIDVGKNGPEAAWKRGKLAVDFVFEDGQWKIWHLLELDDILVPTGKSWPEKSMTVAEFAPCGIELPETEKPKYVHSAYRAERPMGKFPPVPEAYETFADTFSYGV